MEKKVKQNKNIQLKKKTSFDFIPAVQEQTKLYQKEVVKNENELIDELGKELVVVTNEIDNKQEHVNKARNKNNLALYNNLSPKKKVQTKEKNKFIFYSPNVKSKISIDCKAIEDKIKNIGRKKIFEVNDRLYYSWYRDKKRNNIDNFMKKSKLTEFIVYNRIKDKISRRKRGLLWPGI